MTMVVVGSAGAQLRRMGFGWSVAAGRWPLAVGRQPSALAARGLVKADAGAQPDVLVAYHASFNRNLQISGFSSGWGGHRFAASRSGSARAEEILVGTLVPDLVDAKSRTIVWRGIASKEVDVKASPEKRDKNINQAAEKLFKNYPPRT